MTLCDALIISEFKPQDERGCDNVLEKKLVSVGMGISE